MFLLSILVSTCLYLYYTPKAQDINQKAQKILLKALDIAIFRMYYSVVLKAQCNHHMEGGNEMAMHLRAARVNAGLTQAKAAEHLEISKNTLVSYEMYRTKPDIEMAKKIAALYGMTVDDIIFFAE